MFSTVGFLCSGRGRGLGVGWAGHGLGGFFFFFFRDPQKHCSGAGDKSAENTQRCDDQREIIISADQIYQQPSSDILMHITQIPISLFY